MSSNPTLGTLRRFAYNPDYLLKGLPHNSGSRRVSYDGRTVRARRGWYHLISRQLASKGFRGFINLLGGCESWSIFKYLYLKLFSPAYTLCLFGAGGYFFQYLLNSVFTGNESYGLLLLLVVSVDVSRETQTQPHCLVWRKPSEGNFTPLRLSTWQVFEDEEGESWYPSTFPVWFLHQSFTVWCEANS